MTERAETEGEAAEVAVPPVEQPSPEHVEGPGVPSPADAPTVGAAQPAPTVAAPEPDPPAWEPPPARPGEPAPTAVQGSEHPEYAVAGAFAGGFVLATILRRLARD